MRPSSPTLRTSGFGSESGFAQCVWQHTLPALSPVASRARRISSTSIPPIGSTPSKPASLTAFALSITEPGAPIVPHMMPLRIRRRPGFASETGSGDAGAEVAQPVDSGAIAAIAPAETESWRKERRSMSGDD